MYTRNYVIALKTAAHRQTTRLEEPWLTAEPDAEACGVDPALLLPSEANTRRWDTLDALLMQLSMPERVYALVTWTPPTGAKDARALAIVGNATDGFEVADLLADNFPHGPIRRGLHTLDALHQYLEQHALTAGNVEFVTAEKPKLAILQKQPAAAAAAESEASEGGTEQASNNKPAVVAKSAKKRAKVEVKAQ